MSRYNDGGWAPYVSVGERQAKAERLQKKLKKQGIVCQPVQVQGRGIAQTFWGKKWCDNLERHSDYETRLPRGRSYVRNGLVVDLRIGPGKVTAQVAGSELYHVNIDIDPIAPAHWQAIVDECAGQVSSLVELLQGKFSKATMEVVTRQHTGLLPSPRQMRFSCTCPDYAGMCKHTAASLYGIGVRLDTDPALLFELCGVDPMALVQKAATLPVASASAALAPHQQLDGTDLSALFGIDLHEGAGAVAQGFVLAPAAPTPATPPTPKRRKASHSKANQPKANHAKAVPRSFRAKALLELGVPRHVQQKWLRQGVLMRTDTRGVYQEGEQFGQVFEVFLQG